MCPLSESMSQLALVRQKHKRRHSISGDGLTASEEAEEEKHSKLQLLNGPQEHPKHTPSTTPPVSIRDRKASISFRTDQFGANLQPTLRMLHIQASKEKEHQQQSL